MVKSIEDMNKPELDRFAKDEYGIDLDRREKLSTMRSDLNNALKTRKKDLFADFFKAGSDRLKNVHELAEFSGKSLFDAKALAWSWRERGLVNYNLARGSIFLLDDVSLDDSRGGD